jgi:hypothetical protein
MQTFIKVPYIIICFIFLANDISTQSIDAILRKYKNDETATSIKYQGDNLNKAIKSQKKDLKTKLDYIDILGFKSDDISVKDKTSIKNVLTTQKYDELINIKSKGGLVKVSTLYKGDIINKLYAQFSSNELGNYYAVLSGKIHLEEISQIVSNLNIKELDFLKIISSGSNPK